MSFKFRISGFKLGGTLGAWLGLGCAALAGDFASRCADRAAIERVYYQHRLGQKPSFAQVLPPPTLENLVRQDLRQEAALKKVYAVEITPAMLEAEVRRIDATTRAPEMLAEIKSALGHDPARFARSFAQPIVAERLLRERFENDDALHAPQRRLVEHTRRALLAAKQDGAGVEKLLALLQREHSNALTETDWQLGARPTEKGGVETSHEAEIKQRFGPNARILSPSPTGDGRAGKLYFADLPGELQDVLRAQMRQAGDVSAVIETPRGFLLYVAKEKTDAQLRVAGLSLPKRSYEAWLEEQNDSTP